MPTIYQGLYQVLSTQRWINGQRLCPNSTYSLVREAHSELVGITSISTTEGKGHGGNKFEAQNGNNGNKEKTMGRNRSYLDK